MLRLVLPVIGENSVATATIHASTATAEMLGTAALTQTYQPRQRPSQKQHQQQQHIQRQTIKAPRHIPCHHIMSP